MEKKIWEGIEKGKYTQTDLGGYWNKRHGWMDYLIAKRMIFSHRIDYYSSGELLDKLHAHSYYELTLIVAGEGVEYISDRQSIPVEPGMAILTKPMEFHMFRLKSPICYERFVIYFRDPGELFPDPNIMNFTSMGNRAFAAFAPPGNMMLSYAASAKEALLEENWACSNAKAYLDICYLFLILSDQKTVSVSRTHLPEYISRIKEYVDTNFLTLRSVEDVVKQFFYSREYISRSFQKYYNTSLYDYILNRKIMYCCTLLQEGELVQVAARSAGFCNMSSFVKIFRKYNGCTPSEYKDNHRNCIKRGERNQ